MGTRWITGLLVALLVAAGLLLTEGHEGPPIEGPESLDEPADSRVAAALSGVGSDGDAKDEPLRNGDEPSDADAAASDPTAVKPKPWFFAARVLRRSDQEPHPVAGATVRVYLEVARSFEHVGTGVSGPSGHVQIDLRALSTRSRAQLSLARLQAYASAPGHHSYRGAPRTIDRLLDAKDVPTLWFTELHLKAGAVVHGRVVQPDGLGIPHVNVSLRPKSREPRVIPAITFTDAGGYFAVPIREPDTYRVVAHKRGMLGRASDPAALTGRADHEVADLVMRPQEGRSGVVRFADGTAVRDLSLEFDHPRFHMRGTLWTPGLGAIKVRTDHAGRFSLALPQMPDYPDVPDFHYTVQIPGMVSGDTGFDPAAERIEIRIPGHRLIVRVRDQFGGPLRGQEIVFRDQDRERDAILETTDERGQVSLFVPHGAVGVLLVRRRGQVPVFRSVRIPVTGNESTVVLDTPDEMPLAAIGARARTSSGRMVFPLRVFAYTLEGVQVVAKDLRDDAHRLSLPPGQYRVRFLSRHKLPWSSDVRSWSRMDLPEPVALRAGDDLQIDLHWRKASGLAVLLRAEDAARKEPARGLCYIEPVKGARQRLHFQTGNGTRVGVELALDRLLYSWPLFEPGRYRVTIEAEGYRTMTKEVVLRDEQLTRVEFDMEREP